MSVKKNNEKALIDEIVSYSWTISDGDVNMAVVQTNIQHDMLTPIGELDFEVRIHGSKFLFPLIDSDSIHTIFAIKTTPQFNELYSFFDAYVAVFNDAITGQTQAYVGSKDGYLCLLLPLYQRASEFTSATFSIDYMRGSLSSDQLIGWDVTAINGGVSGWTEEEFAKFGIQLIKTRFIKSNQLSASGTSGGGDTGGGGGVDLSGILEAIDNLTVATQTNASAIAHKQDKETGKGLSTNDFTTEDKEAVSGLGSMSQVDDVDPTEDIPQLRTNLGWVDATFAIVQGNPLENTVLADEINKKANAVSVETKFTLVDKTAADNLEAAKSYTDTEVSKLLENIAGGELDVNMDSFFELIAFMKGNKDAIDILQSAITNKLDAVTYEAFLINYNAAITSKVDKVVGQGLSSNDFTDVLKAKLESLDTTGGVTAEQLATKVDKVTGKSLVSDDLITKLDALPTGDNLATTFNGKQDKEADKGLSSNDFTSELQTKLTELPTFASLSATLDDKAGVTDLDAKVDKEDGKGLSSNDFTMAMSTKLSQLPTGTEIYANLDKKANTSDLADKVDVVLGKELSTNDFTDILASKLNELPTNADLTATLSKKANTSDLSTKVDVVLGKELSSNDFTDALQTKLTDLPSDTDLTALLAAKANTTDLANKVDAEAGKGLSTNDFTNELKTKLEDLSSFGGVTPDQLETKVDKVAGKSLISDELIIKLDALPTNDGLNKTLSGKADATALDAKVDKEIGKGLSSNDFTTELSTKLTQLPTSGELATSFDNKANVSDLSNKVDVISGKGLSTNDFTDELKTKLEGLSDTVGGVTPEQLATKVDKVTGKSLVSDTSITKLESLPTSESLSTSFDGKQDKVTGKGLSTNDFTDALETKLTDLPTNANLNTTLSGKANTSDLSNKVDKVSGKGLSTNDFTNELKAKLEGLSDTGGGGSGGGGSAGGTEEIIKRKTFKTSFSDRSTGWAKVASMGVVDYLNIKGSLNRTVPNGDTVSFDVNINGNSARKRATGLVHADIYTSSTFSALVVDSSLNIWVYRQGTQDAISLDITYGIHDAYPDIVQFEPSLLFNSTTPSLPTPLVDLRNITDGSWILAHNAGGLKKITTEV